MRHLYIVELDGVGVLIAEITKEYYDDCPVPSSVIRRMASDILEAVLFDPAVLDEISDQILAIAGAVLDEIRTLLTAYLNTVCTPSEFHVLDDDGSIAITTL